MIALGLRLIPSPKIRRGLLSKNKYLNPVLEADFVTAIGGGDSFSDIYGLARLTYIALPQFLVLALGKPLVLLPQTIGPFKTCTGRTIGRMILQRAKQIYTRDVESMEEVERIAGDKKNVSFAYDMGFALEPLPPAAEIKKEVCGMGEAGDLVGLNISGLLYRYGYTGKNEFGLRSDYQILVRRLIKVLIEDLGLNVLLVPHVFGGPGTEGDNHPCRELWEELSSRYHGRLKTLRGQLGQHEVKWVIGQCKFFIGSRMHACIAAISQYVPAVGLAYSRKFAGVLDTVGGGSRVIDLRQADIDKVTNTIVKALAERETLRNELKTRIPAIRDSVLNLFANIQVEPDGDR